MTAMFIAVCWLAAALGYGGIGLWVWLKLKRSKS